MYRQFHLQKTTELYCDLWKTFLFQMNTDNSGNSIDLTLVGKCPLSVSDYRKEEIIRSMNLINGFGARSYSIRGIHFLIVLLT